MAFVYDEAQNAIIGTQEGNEVLRIEIEATSLGRDLELEVVTTIIGVLTMLRLLLMAKYRSSVIKSILLLILQAQILVVTAFKRLLTLRQPLLMAMILRRKTLLLKTLNLLLHQSLAPLLILLVINWHRSRLIKKDLVSSMAY